MRTIQCQCACRNGRILTILTAVFVGSLVSMGALAQSVQIEPSRVVFPSVESSATIQVRQNGEPVPQNQISRVTVEPAYARMFRVRRPEDQAGRIIVETVPSQIEVGSYYIEIEAAGQRVRGTLIATLDAHKSIIEAEAAERGESIEETRRRYGMTQFLLDESINIRMPQRFIEGSYLLLDIVAEGDRRYTFYVNGEPVATDTGGLQLRHTLAQPGQLELALRVEDNGILVAEWQGQTTVVEESPLPHAVPRNTEFTLTAPEGFERYEWRVGDQLIGEGQRLTHSFTDPGTYTVECLALNPETDPLRAYRRITWSIDVTD